MPALSSWCPDGSSLWQFNADTHITDWLEAMGYEFDVITDEDLHYQGFELLKPYRVILTGSHPEYHSRQMWDAMMAYQQLVPGQIGVRRNEGGSRAGAGEPGDYSNFFPGEYGALWPRQGRPPQM